MPPADFDPLVQAKLGTLHAWLGERGETIVGSGCIRSGRTTVVLHTDYGPEGQDKETNQDYGLLWKETGRQRVDPLLVLAIGDGLTSSFRSEWASALACSVAVRTLVEDIQRNDSVPVAHSTSLARRAFENAGQALGQLSDEFAVDPQASCPKGQYLSTWKYIVRRGLLLQTTLTLAWLYEEHLSVAILGDTGALWKTADQDKTQVLVQCDESTHEVNALGPASRTLSQLDFWVERPWMGLTACAIFTDGIGRSLELSSEASFMERLDLLRKHGAENPALEFIRTAIVESSPRFDDNVTLAVWTKD